MKLRDYIFSALISAMICVLSYIYIPLPFSIVPVTGQTLGVMLAGSVLKAKFAALSIITYLLLGTAGLPVFGGGNSGIGVIIGPKGGYYIGFLAGAVVISLLKGKKNNIYRLAAANAIGGIIAVHIIGFPWLSAATGMGIFEAFKAGTLFFIPGDIIKVIGAALIGFAVNKQIMRLH